LAGQKVREYVSKPCVGDFFQKLLPGKDIGIHMCDDLPFSEIVGEGTTALTSDFGQKRQPISTMNFDNMRSNLKHHSN
jgi:hypothetical protein